jgi:hypothetical protein
MRQVRRMRTVFLTAALVAVSLAPAPAPAQAPPSPNPVPSTSPAAPNPAPTSLSEFARGRIDAMLRSGHADPASFSASFLAQIPASQIDAIIAQLTGALGAYKSIDGTQGNYTAHFEKGIDQVLVHLDADNKIDGILFKPPVVQAASL